MRLQFNNTVRVKKLADCLSIYSELKHSQLLDVISQVCGFNNFHELDNSCRMNNIDTAKEVSYSSDERVALVGRLTTEANINFGDALDALENSRLLGNKSIGQKRLLDIRAESYRREYQSGSMKRKKGEVGKLLNLPSGNNYGIFRWQDRAMHVITHKSANSIVASSEYLSPRVPLQFFIPMRLYLPYGHWVEKDGSWVLFSRDYFPLWRIRKDSAPERLDPVEQIQYESQIHYWGNHRWPWSHPDLYDELIEQLDEFGIRSLPRLVESFKRILDSNQIEDFRDVFKKFT